MDRTAAKRRLRTVAVSFAAGMAIGLGVLMGLDLFSRNRPVKGSAATRILVNKTERRLYLYNGPQEVGCFRVGLGFEAKGDKLQSGDGKTPEGKYYVCAKNPNSKYYLSIGISYPNIADAKRGLEAGLIDSEQYSKICEAIKAKQSPPWDTALGGEIFIHGHGATKDWTLGCVAMDNVDIKLLYDAVSLGTPVEIVAGQKSEAISILAFEIATSSR